MPIDIPSLENLYKNEPDNADMRWVGIPDSKEGTINPRLLGSSGGNRRNGWKIHISINPEQVSLAVRLIAEELNKVNSPRVSVKFANKSLSRSPTSQPAKQVAIVFYDEELLNLRKIAIFFK